MGIIRFLLAISVVLYHVSIDRKWTGTGGEASVQAFYMISGFYIAMVLSGPYDRAVLSFWVNRILRLYPAYFVVAIATLLLRLAFSPELVQLFRDLPGAAKAFIVSSNILVFGQDWALFLGVRDHALQFVTNYHNSVPELWKLELDPPAWSLDIELTFYLIAPFLLRLRVPFLLGTMALSILLRIILVRHGLSFDPWTYRFFPTELALFLAGAIAQKTSRSFRTTLPRLFHHGDLATATMVAMIVIFPIVPAPTAVRSVVLFVFLAVFLPVIFENAKSNKIDRYIGDLSYVLYISHWLVILAVRRFIGDGHSLGSKLTVVGATIVCALALGAAVDWPLRAIRARVRNAARRESSERAGGPVLVNP
jgi:peptidoglycan/LPS O-acetylase OafA/YrhL